MSGFDFSGKRVVVTGGAGFIGSHVVRALSAAGAERITVIDSLRYGDLTNLGAEAERVALIRHTLGTDPIEALAAPLEADLLIHLAAEKHNQSKDDPTRVVRANIEGTLALLCEAARRGVKRVVFASSLYAYGRMSGADYQEDELPAPSTVYGVSKLAGEQLLRYAAAEFGISWLALRYLFVYGPRQFAGMGYKSVILKTFEHIQRGEQPVVYGDGEQRLDYVFVDDVVTATLRAAEAELTGEVLNVASGEATSVNQLVDLMLEVSGSSLTKRHEPPDWTQGSRRVGDPTRIAERLGWRKATSLGEGLEATWRWCAHR
ncbi:MAG: NAD-dependent epimerase/dehydratase family protein [Polyangiaceae bacterium]|nr:NAD-dependent epimerase/dehydratase family protein [Polyangiaceae bacterium]MCW5790564.1 NAD-dependent epimerase/dehydratase family protein [Polyangiaceae bacterium]